MKVMIELSGKNSEHHELYLKNVKDDSEHISIMINDEESIVNVEELKVAIRKICTK